MHISRMDKTLLTIVMQFYRDKASQLLCAELLTVPVIVE